MKKPLNKVQSTTDIVIAVSLIIFIYVHRVVKNKTDKILLKSGIIGAITYIIARLFKIQAFINITHIMYFFLVLLIPFLANEKITLYLYLLVVAITLITRFIYKECILSRLEKKQVDGYDENNVFYTIYERYFNWTLTTSIWGAIALGRLIIQFK
tara:strand:- start:55 stop:519 length:465 start_codon:yes stop_codon:yes gene_type:complete